MEAGGWLLACIHTQETVCDQEAGLGCDLKVRPQWTTFFRELPPHTGFPTFPNSATGGRQSSNVSQWGTRHTQTTIPPLEANAHTDVWTLILFGDSSIWLRIRHFSVAVINILSKSNLWERVSWALEGESAHDRKHGGGAGS